MNTTNGQKIGLPKLVRIWGILGIGLGILINPWSMWHLFGTGLKLNPQVKTAIIIFEFASIGIGMMLVVFSKTLGRILGRSPYHYIISFIKIIFYFVVILMSCEIAVRLYGMVQVGSDAFFYGTRLRSRYKRNIQSTTHPNDHRESHMGYTTYAPYQEIWTKDLDSNGDAFRVMINNRGFRGKDIVKEKARDIIRIITLGASSTFGFRNRDNETYPFYMEKKLNEKYSGDETIEVINMGIPHLTSDQVAALFEKEALNLNPDIVTYYQGVADTRKKNAYHDNFIQFLGGHLMLVAFIDDVFLHSQERFSRKFVQQHFLGKSEWYLSNLERIRKICDENDILFVVVSQQAKSYCIPRDKIRGMSYDAEVQLIRNNLLNGNKITDGELYFLTHDKLMNALRTWVVQNRVTCVDGLKALDNRRDVLTSWVHLTAEGNRILAEVISEKILAYLSEEKE